MWFDDCLFCPFFVLLMLIKRGVETKGCQMLLYCCRHAIVILYHPPSGQCSGNEVQRVSQVILHSGGVYVCVYMCIYPYASPLDYAIPFSLTKISLSCPILSSSLFFSAVAFDSEYNVLVHPPYGKMSVKEHTKLRLIFLMSNAF